MGSDLGVRAVISHPWDMKLTVKANIANRCNLLPRASFPVTADCGRRSSRRSGRLPTGKTRKCPHTSTGPHAASATDAGHQLLPAGPICELPQFSAGCPAEGRSPGSGRLQCCGEHWNCLPLSEKAQVFSKLLSICKAVAPCHC